MSVRSNALILLLLLLVLVSLTSAKLQRAEYKFPNNSTSEVAVTDAPDEDDDEEELPVRGPDGGLQVVHVAEQAGGIGKKLDNEYILKVSRRVDVQPLVDDFEVTFPNANVTHIFTNAYHGFSVQGVSEEEVRNFANGCDNMVLQIQENAEAHINTPPTPAPSTTTTSNATSTASSNATTIAAVRPEWGLDRIDARKGTNKAYQPKATGAGVKIYVIDTGVRLTHTELTGRVAEGRDFTGEGMFDGNGHGTHVAGTCAGTTYGVAKEAIIVPVKVLNRQGSGSFADILAGIDWVKTQHEQSQDDKSVANLSLGGGYSAALNAAIESAVRAGVVVVVAAGNESMDACATSPASARAAITVGSIDQQDSRSGFSNFGTCVDIFAPGSSIKSASSTGDSATDTLSGTSMAAPHVAGAAALVLQSDPRINGHDVWSVLNGMATLDTVASPGSQSPNKLLYVGDIKAAKPPATKPDEPTGRVTFTVRYDTYPEETYFDLWELAGSQWHQQQTYRPAGKKAAGKDTIVTRHYRNGFYAFDMHDKYGDGIASGYVKDYDAGYFKITETDTGKLIYQGGDFDTYFSVEFEVKDGVITLSDVIDL